MNENKKGASNTNKIESLDKKDLIKEASSADTQDYAKNMTGSKTLQMVLIAIFSLVFLYIIQKPFRSFKSTDEAPAIISLTPQKIINFGGFPSEIVCGAYIREISEMDIINNKLAMNLTIWFRFNPKAISLARIGQFTIDNAETSNKSEPITRADGNLVVALYDIKANLSLRLDYKNFPFDDHIINLSITNHNLSPYEAIFESSKTNLMIDEKIDISGWKIVDRWVKTGFIEDILNPKNRASSRIHPKVIYSLSIHRVGARHFITLIIPLILIFFIAAFTLAFDPTESTVGIAIAAISAIVAQRFIMETVSPQSNSLMISDEIFLIYLFLSCIIFFITVFAGKISGFLKNIITILLYIFALVSTIYFMHPFA